MSNAKLNEFKKTKWFRRLVWSSVVLLVYIIVGFLVLPAVIKSQLIKRLPEVTKRQVAIADVKLNPFALSYTMRGFSLTETNGETFVSVGELYVNFELGSSILNGAWTLGEVSVKEPFGQVTRKADGTFNFENLIPAADTNAVKEVKPLPAVMMELLSIEGGTVAFTDETRPGPFKTKIAPIKFDLTQLTTRPDKNSPYAFTASDDAGMKLSWSGRVAVQPPSSTGKLKIEGVYLPKYAGYMSEFFAGEIAQGTVNVEGEYGFSLAGKTPSVTLTNGLVQVRNLKVTAKGETLVVLPMVDVRAITASLEERSIKVAELVTSGLKANVVREKDGSIDLLNLIVSQPVKTNGTAVVATVSSNAVVPWRVALGSLQVTNYSVSVEDRTLAKPAKLKVDQVAVQVDGFQLTTNATLATKIFARLNEAGTVEVSGPVHVFPLDGELTIALKEMDLRPLQPFAAPFVNVAIRSGLLSTSGKATFSLPAGGAPKLQFSGDVKLDKFDTADGTEFQDFVKWETLAISGIQLQSEPQDLQVQEVRLKGLQTSLIIGTNKQSNIETILMTKAKTTNEVVAVTNQTAIASAPASTNVVPVKLTKLVLEDGSLKFVDNSIQPHAVIAVQKFDVSVDGLSTIGEQPATVSISGRVDELAPFSVTGRVRPVLTNLLVDLVISNRNTDMTAFTPYMEKFGGYPIMKGKVSVGLKYEITGMALKSEHSVVVDQFSLGAKNSSPDAINLPLKLGVALLKDRHGKIELDLPVNGRLDDPQFRVLPVVMKVLVNLVTKAVASPFALLGKLVGGGEEMSFVAFEPGNGEISAGEQGKMEKLAKALYERPGLNLEIAGAVELKADREALTKLKFEQQLKALRLKEIAATGVVPPAISEVKLEGADRERLLMAAYVEAFGALPAVTNVMTTAAVTNAPATVTNVPIATKPVETVKKSEIKSEVKTKKPTAGVLQGAAAQMALAERKKKATTSAKQEAAQEVKKETPSAVVKTETPKAVETTAGTSTQAVTPTITVAEMEAKLLARVKVEDNELRDLMQQRAQSVQAFLLKTEKVTAERLFIIAPKALDETYRGESKVDLLLN